MTYSVDFRRKVLSVRSQERLTFQQVADRFGVGGASVVRWSRCLEPQLTRNKPATRINMDALARDVEAYPPMLINMNVPRVWGSVFAVLVTRSSVLV